jgi:hypothetical protein
MSKRSAGRGVVTVALALALLAVASAPAQARGVDTKAIPALTEVWNLAWDWLAGFFGTAKGTGTSVPKTDVPYGNNGGGSQTNGGPCQGEGGGAMDPNGCPGRP